MTPTSLSLESYQTPMDPRLGEPRPESGFRNELLRLSAKRVMAALFRKDSFSSDSLLGEIEEMTPRITETALRNTLTHEKAMHQLNLEDECPDYFYQKYSPLLSHIFPDHKKITDINLGDIKVPDDLITEIVKNIKEVFQYCDTLQILEEVHPYISSEIQKISQKAIVLTRKIKSDYEGWEEWMNEQVENPNALIEWKDIDRIFFTVAFPVRAQQSLEAIFTTTALVQLLEGYKTPDTSEIEKDFISLLQEYFKKQAIFSATDSIDFGEEEDEDNEEVKEDKEVSILGIRIQGKQEIEDILGRIQQALSKRPNTKIFRMFKRFRSDIDRANERTAFMSQSNRLGIQSTKEHWVGSYGIRDLLMIKNRT